MKKSLYTTVYRFEHCVDNLGPYQCRYDSSTLEEMYSAHNSCIYTCNPIPGYDGIDFNSGELCACSSMKQLHSWFGEFFKPLLKEGFRVVKYFVKKSDLKRGRYQVVFSPTNSPIKKQLFLSSKG